MKVRSNQGHSNLLSLGISIGKLLSLIQSGLSEQDERALGVDLEELYEKYTNLVQTKE
jgi:hypothetical protein